MSIHHLFRLVVLVGLAAMAGQASGQDKPSAKDDDTVTRYEVRGKSTQSNADRPWSESFASKADAEAEMKTIRKDHSAGGLLASSTDKPVGLYVQPVKIRQFRPSGKSPEGRTEAPPTGTRYTVTVKLKQKGEWTELKDKEKSFESYAAALRYMNQQNTDPDQRATIQSVVGGLPSVDPGPLNSTAPVAKGKVNKLADTVWNARSLSSYGGELRFSKDGETVIHAENGGGPHPASTYKGTYKVDGDSVTMKIQYNGDSWLNYTGTISQKKISGTYKREGGNFTYEWEIKQH